MGDAIVVKNKMKDWAPFMYGIDIGMICFCLIMTKLFYDKGGHAWIVVIFAMDLPMIICLAIITIKETMQEGKTIVFTSLGCEITVFRYHRFYNWNELSVIEYREYQYHPYPYTKSHNGLDNNYSSFEPCYEGMVFSKKNLSQKVDIYRATRKFPFDTFIVNFYTDRHGKPAKHTTSKKTLRMFYSVDKEDFLTHMALWGVHIENLPSS